MTANSHEFQPPCKVCERGVLAKRKVFRMSGPVVAIGFILLIPSIAGITASGLILLGTLSYGSHDVRDSDMQFRYNCIATDQPNAGTYSAAETPMPILIPFCECELSAVKNGKALSDAMQKCMQAMQNGTLPVIDSQTKALIDENLFPNGVLTKPPEPEQASIFARVIGGGFAIFLAIASFVGGLLGWLLIMRKRVLQCSVCGATVAAS